MPSVTNLQLFLMKNARNSHLPIPQRIAYFKGESQEILRLKEKNNLIECCCNQNLHNPTAGRERLSSTWSIAETLLTRILYTGIMRKI